MQVRIVVEHDANKAEYVREYGIRRAIYTVGTNVDRVVIAWEPDASTETRVRLQGDVTQVLDASHRVVTASIQNAYVSSIEVEM